MSISSRLTPISILEALFSCELKKELHKFIFISLTITSAPIEAWAVKLEIMRDRAATRQTDMRSYSDVSLPIRNT